MLLTFTPNPCIERTLRAPELKLGGRVRVAPHDVAVTAGGKGLNASRVAASFGVPTRAVVPVGRLERAFFEHHLRLDGLEPHFIESAAPTRTCLNVLGPDGSTEILEAGWSPPLEVGTQILAAWRDGLRDAKIALIGGSYPPSDEAAWNQHALILCSLARAANVPLVYDGPGEALQRAVFSKTPPWGIKPNRDEAELLLGRELNDQNAKILAVRELLRRVECVLLSDGENGLFLGWRGAVYFLSSPEINFVSAVGCGDALVGAFAAKLALGCDVEEAARWGVAAGALNAARFEAARVKRDEIAPLVEKITPKLLDVALVA